MRRDTEMVALLLSKGADRAAMNEFGNTPLRMVMNDRDELPRRTFTTLKQLLRIT